MSSVHVGGQPKSDAVHCADSRPSLFSFSCALAGISDFSALCRQVYFPTEGFSHATFAIVNSGLYNIFMEQAALLEDPVKQEEYQAHGRVAQANLETYLANLPLFLPAKLENVQALLCGVRPSQATPPPLICRTGSRGTMYLPIAPVTICH